MTLEAVRKLLKSRAIGLTVTVATTLIGVGIVVPRSAGAATAPPYEETTRPPYVTPGVWKKMRDQQPSLAAASAIRSAIEANKSISDGFTSIALTEKGVDVYWKGSVPAVIDDVIRRAHTNVPVVVHSAAYSQKELKAASYQILSQEMGDASPDRISEVSIPIDGKSLDVGTEGNPSLSAPRVRSRLQSTTSANAGVAKELATTIPISSKKVKIRPTSRYGDVAPYSGGAAFYSTRFDHGCTLGWGLANNRLLTAGHCGQVNDKFNVLKGGSGTEQRTSTLVGKAIQEIESHDVLLLDGNGSNTMWDGPLGAGEYTKNVVGWDWTFPGEWVCFSGITSGTVCNQRNDGNLSSSYPVHDDDTNRDILWTDMIVASNPNSPGSASLSGDSGVAGTR